MRTIIAGSRDIIDLDVVLEAIANSGIDITTVVSGGARGVDTLGEHAAKMMGIPVTRYEAEWDVYGKSAGYKRNGVMAKNADALIAVWDGKSKGTEHMITLARLRGLKVFVWRA